MTSGSDTPRPSQIAPQGEPWKDFGDALDYLASLDVCDPRNCLVHRLEMEERRDRTVG